MVVDHVHDHAQAVLVQGLHHFTKLKDALRAFGRVGAVAAFGCTVVIGVIAPVKAVGGAGGAHAGLLLVGVTGVAHGIGGNGARYAAFGHGGDVEGGQEVDVGQAGLLELKQVAHAVGEGGVGVGAAAVVGEGAVGAAVVCGNAAVVDAEVADVHFVDDNVFGRGQGGLGQAVPAGGFQVGVV